MTHENIPEMMATQARRPTHQGNQMFHPAPNAALLIDFDNVTMGIRSDLGKELKSLLNSDVIRGKVAVQRAYADWRRYPQYIVPLAESSIDLIFAPAYGSSKKNATDLRMAIDAIELVFTRPEIGTYILMTGDSDFSSCVLKLKEYGKYVIGVGMRESSSDLLIQNCDEYYSYHSLSGLTRTSEDESSREDPWGLVKRAAQQMVTNGDTMRADRLKQVMLDLDPSFNEKDLGYSKFSRFVSEASTRGLIRLKKMENGQYEIVLDGEAAPEPGKSTEAATSRESRRGRRRESPQTPPAEPVEVASTPDVAKAPAAQPEPAGDLQGAYALLQQAVRALGGDNTKGVRDGDVKRKMLDLSPGFDESAFGFSKFSRFLRQAHDTEVIDLHRISSGHYEVKLSANAPRMPQPTAETRQASKEAEPVPAKTAAAPTQQAGRRLHMRHGGRTPASDAPPPLLPGQTVSVPTTPAAKPEAPDAAPTPAPIESKDTSAEAGEAAAPAADKRRRGRRGRRRTSTTEPPELLPGQVASTPESAKPAPSEEAPKKRSRSRTRKPKSEPAKPAFSSKDLGLPRGRNAIQAYLTNSYKGVGKKTAETLLDAFGDDLFQSLQEQPERVRDLLGERRGAALLEQWSADHERRRSAQSDHKADTEKEAEQPNAALPAGESDAEADKSAATRSRSKSRRGGRGRGRGRKAEPATT